MAKIRFYSDEHISKAVIQGLRARGRPRSFSCAGRTSTSSGAAFISPIPRPANGRSCSTLRRGSFKA